MGESGEISTVKNSTAIRIGSRSRCYLAGFAKEGEIYQVDQPSPDEIRLRRMDAKKTKRPEMRLVVKDGMPVIQGGPIVTDEMVAKALEDFP